MAEEIHLEDWGTEMIARVRDSSGPIDLADFTGYGFRFKAPNTEAISVQPFILGPSTDGTLIYTIPLTWLGGWFFHTTGIWSWQVLLGTSGVGSWHSNVVKFRVYPNI